MRGLLIVYTGKGKGKTTAALGLAVRAMGHGFRVCLIQFIKGMRNTGEVNALARFGDLMDIRVMGRGCILQSRELEKDRIAAREAWELSKETLASPAYDVVLLDELTHALNHGFIAEREVCEVLEARKKGLHVIVTGRGAPPALMDMADLVTEMREIKHPLKKGIKAQQGIEF
jgi:cob(I)alamin adenosyltransferase